MASTVQQTRSEPRKPLETAVHVYGIDSSGNTINKSAWTVDVSRRGVRLKGLTFRVRPGETLGVRYGTEKARYRVVWLGDPASPLQGQAGLVSMDKGEVTWGEGGA